MATIILTEGSSRGEVEKKNIKKGAQIGTLF
jgi:hypothetical protein